MEVVFLEMDIISHRVSALGRHLKESGGSSGGATPLWVLLHLPFQGQEPGLGRRLMSLRGAPPRIGVLWSMTARRTQGLSTGIGFLVKLTQGASSYITVF